MQRNNGPLGSRYNISNPRPPPNGNGLDFLAGMSDGPYPSLRPPPAQGSSGGWSGAPQAGDPRSSPTASVASLPQTRSPARRYGDLPPPTSSPLRANGGGGHTRMPSDASTGPLRPARSQRRKENMSITERPQPTTHANMLAPLRTSDRDLERPDSQELISPIGPGEIPLVATPTAEGEDPFAMDRLQRTQARKATLQTPNSALHASSPAATPEDRMRKAVAAFTQNRKESHESDSKPPVRRPPRRRGNTVTRQQNESWDDFYMGGGKFAELDSVMKVIRKEWPFVIGAEFSPSTLALSLLSSQPSQTLGPHPDLYHFQNVHNGLSNALQKAVRGHFQTFAASLPTHATFVATLDRAQDQVKSSREALKQAKEGLAGKSKAELASVRARERMVREMLQVVDYIDELKQAPEQLEAWISEKKFLQAALLLVKSIKGINREALQEIGALSDLRQYFQSQENTLSDILIEELHNHIYLKAFNSESRWKAYTPGQTMVPVITAEEDQPTPQDGGDNSRFSQFLSHLAVKPNHIPNLDEVTAANGATPNRVSLSMSRATSMTSLASVAAGPDVGTGGSETDSFTYMETLLEALAALGRLGSALDMLVQRVPSEIHQLVDATMEEVEERIEQRASDLTNMLNSSSNLLSDRNELESMPLFDGDTLRVVVSLDATGPPENAIVLRDLFWTLYSKLAAVMEGHRAVYEVARWIASRRDFKDTTKADLNLNVPVLEIWRPVQQEVRALLQAYLSDDAQGSALKNSALPSINEILREGRLLRDKQKELFRFSDTDARTVNSEIKEIDDSLKQTLRASVPGLVNLQAGDAGNVLGAVTGGEDSRYASSGKIRTLIPPNTFNVTVLFQPTISFIRRATDIIPAGFEDETAQFGAVLEEFVENVFIPQLDEKVTASFQHAVTGYDAYQIDRRSLGSGEKPPLKSTVRVLALIQSLCAMLHESPFHRENYSRLVVGVIGQYYQQVNQHFKDVVTISRRDDGSPLLGLPADWALNGEVDTVLGALRRVAPADVTETLRLEHEEANLELKLCGDNPPVEAQLLNSPRKLEALAHIAQSVRWFMSALLNLQELVKDEDIDKPDLPGSGRDPSSTSPYPSSFPTASPYALSTSSSGPKLPLTRAMAVRFESIVQFYEQLVSMTLNTLHLEIRARVLCNLSAALRRNDYRLESEALEPDPDVVDLNASLLEADRIASLTLHPQDHAFMFKGLGVLIDSVFVSSARKLKHMNGAGARKIRRNILSLQQTLRGIAPLTPSTSSANGNARGMGGEGEDGIVLKSIRFWDLYELGPKRMLGSIGPKPEFGFDDYNAMLSLQCAETGQDLNSHLIDLHALAMDIEGWEMV